MNKLCVRWAMLGALLGLAYSAHGQDPVEAVVIADPNLTVLLSLLQSGGMPVVLAWIGWRAAHGLSTWTPTVRVELVERQRAPRGRDDATEDR